MEKLESGVIQSMWVGPFTGWVTLPADGTSGGIILMWDKRRVDCLEEAVCTFSLSCKFFLVLDQFVWVFSGVYGPNANLDRQFFVGRVVRYFSVVGCSVVHWGGF
jgi:hypothetical protein